MAGANGHHISSDCHYRTLIILIPLREQHVVQTRSILAKKRIRWTKVANDEKSEFDLMCRYSGLYTQIAHEELYDEERRHDEDRHHDNF
ncbi:predicted protein [Botrytis cinerea T4]|uniref:Uncharacterized protein n=1 Tax=Botryotinia fuckeliana (strain T4) TaxID=999810 RepID=G2XSA6_BOTF4|nr:predicted protein [Botrytis cinerea T4]